MAATFIPSRVELNTIAIEELQSIRITEVRASVKNVLDSLNFIWSNIDQEILCHY
jgi:hypothetical protein